MSGMGGKPGWRQAPGWLKLVLILSLSANVAVAGVVGGNAMRHRQDVPLSRMTHNEPGLDRRQTRILHMVPDQRRSEAREILLGRQDEYMAARVTMSAAQQTFTDAIRQDPLDPDRLTAALAERQAASGQIWGIGYEQMVEIARLLNAAERIEMATRLEERTRRWMERQKRRGR